MFRAYFSLLATLAVVAASGCSATTRECDPNTVLLRLKCGDQIFSGGNLVVTRLSDGKKFEESVMLPCPGDDFVFKGKVPDYKSDDVFSVKFSPAAANQAATVKTIKAQSVCVAETIILNGTTTSIVEDGGAGGNTPSPDGPSLPLGTKGPGDTCAAAEECASNFCADGVCCESACTDVCLSCNQTGSPGLCRPNAKGSKPAAGKMCNTTEVQSCGTDGTCDGEGACAKYPDGSVCAKGECDVGGTKGRKVCQAGSCSAQDELPCAPFLCNPETVTCFAKCVDSSQCVPGKNCDSEKSCGKKALGSMCQADTECLSSKCADGFCCNSTCTGGCEACNIIGSQGTCTAVSKGSVDPHGMCKADAIPTCQKTGLCDGQKGCSLYEANAVCSAAVCNGNQFVASSRCDGAGRCVEGSTTACAPFACTVASCVQTCKNDTECVGGNLCISGSCGKKMVGATCGGDGECGSTFCRHGVCCEETCSGSCRSCNSPGKAGKCTLAAAGDVDPRGICKDATSAECKLDGKCDAAGGCRQYPSGTECRAPSCNASTNTGSFKFECNGSGTCGQTKDPVSCAPGRCGGNSCTLQCSKNGDCVQPNTCSAGGLCGKIPLGGACNDNSECEMGNCASGVCCNSACSGACQTCDTGQCRMVAAGVKDPRNRCQDQGAPSCGTDSMCDGAGGCRKYSAGTLCKAQSCDSSANKEIPRSECNGAGACNPVGSGTECGAGKCNGMSCSSSCTNDSQCTAPNTCVNLTCQLKPLGSTGCAAGGQCAAGTVCVDNVCCENACSGACKSCSTGRCLNTPSGQADPRSMCTPSAANKCSTTSACDGAGSCSVRPGSTCCGDSDCTSAPANTRGSCVSNACTYPCANLSCKGVCLAAGQCCADSDCPTATTSGKCNDATKGCWQRKTLTIAHPLTDVERVSSCLETYNPFGSNCDNVGGAVVRYAITPVSKVLTSREFGYLRFSPSLAAGAVVESAFLSLGIYRVSPVGPLGSFGGLRLRVAPCNRGSDRESFSTCRTQVNSNSSLLCSRVDDASTCRGDVTEEIRGGARDFVIDFDPTPTASVYVPYVTPVLEITYLVP